MKFDKELLLKHKFWIVAGAFLLTWLIGFFMVWANASGDVEEARKKFTGATTQLKDFTANLTNVVNVSTFLGPWNAYETKFRNHKDAIWHIAWNGQKSLITWPHEVENDPEDKRTELDDVWNACDKFEDWKEKMSSDVPGSNIRERYKEALYFAQFGRRAGGVNEDPVLGRQIRLHPKLASPYEKAKLELAMLVAPAEIRDGTSGFEKMMMPTTGSAGRSNQPGMPQMPFNMGAGGDRGDEGGKNLAGFFGEKAPTVEELWLAQEDYWVKHELLKIIRSTIDKLAALQESPLKPEEQKPGFLAQRRFTNDTWKIDLRFQTTDRGNFISNKSTIRNMDVNQRVLHLANPYTHGGIEFLLRQGNKDYKLEIKGQPLAWGMEAEFGDTKPFDILDPTKPFTMEEIFNWSTCPIRRIDEIKLASHSHRTAHVSLKPNPALTPPPSTGGTPPGSPPPGSGAAPPQAGGRKGAPPGTAPGARPGGSGAPGGQGKGPAPTGGQMPPPPGAMGQNLLTSPHKLLRNRYLYVTKQCRHLPIAMLLVVEQEHIHDLLVALTDSKLRFQVTQIQFRHVKGIASTLPITVSDSKTDTRGQPSNPGRSSRGRPNPGIPGSTNTTDEAGTPDLVELAIYGVAAIYDRCPAKANGPGGDKPKGPTGETPKDKPKGPKGEIPKDKPKGPMGETPKDKPKGPMGETPKDKPKGPMGETPKDKPKGQPMGAAKQ